MRGRKRIAMEASGNSAGRFFLSCLAVLKNRCPLKIRSCYNGLRVFLSSEFIRKLFIVLLPVLVVLRYPVDNVDYDVWWHLALGKYYVTHKTLIADHSVFSWTPTDPTWIYNTCLGSLAVYLFYQVMGGWGLWLMHSLIFLGVFLAFYLFLRLFRKRLDIHSVTLLAAVAVVCSPSCRYYKPELFSLLLFSWAVFIFFYVKVTKKKLLLYVYPLLMALWVNLHGGYIVGLMFLGGAFAGEILNKIFFPRESLERGFLVHFVISMILSLLATFLNPYGLNYVLGTLTDVTSKTYSDLFKTYILAYTSLWPYLTNVKMDFLNGFAVWTMTCMAVFLIGLWVYEFRKRKSWDWVWVVVCFPLYWRGMASSRASYFFAIAFLFVVLYLIEHRLMLQWFFKKMIVFSAFLFLFFFGIVLYLDLRYGTDNYWFGRGLDEFVPVEEVAFLKKYKLEGPIFNDYVIGGYLMWALYPDYKVFIDPRCSPYRNGVLQDYVNFTTRRVKAEDLVRFRKKYPFKLAVLHYRQMILIFDFLQAEGDEWRLLYFGKNAAILIHKSLLPVVKTEVGNVSLSPLRFRNVASAAVLTNVFHFYVRLNPAAGRYIYEVFKRNVSDCYKLKPQILSLMEQEIQIKEEEVKQKMMWMSP